MHQGALGPKSRQGRRVGSIFFHGVHFGTGYDQVLAIAQPLQDTTGPESAWEIFFSTLASHGCQRYRWHDATMRVSCCRNLLIQELAGTKLWPCLDVNTVFIWNCEFFLEQNMRQLPVVPRTRTSYPSLPRLSHTLDVPKCAKLRPNHTVKQSTCSWHLVEYSDSLGMPNTCRL